MKENRVCEIRGEAAADDSKALRLEGIPIVYTQPTNVGHTVGSASALNRTGQPAHTDGHAVWTAAK